MKSNPLAEFKKKAWQEYRQAEQRAWEMYQSSIAAFAQALEKSVKRRIKHV